MGDCHLFSGKSPGGVACGGGDADDLFLRECGDNIEAVIMFGWDEK